MQEDADEEVKEGEQINKNDDSWGGGSKKTPVQKKPVQKKRDLKANGKQNIKAYHQEKGHQLSHVEETQKRNKRKAFQDAMELCNFYLTEANKPTYGEVSDADIYLKPDELETLAVEARGETYATPPKIVDTKKMYEKYFNGPDGVERAWKIIVEDLELSQMQKLIYVRCWFPSENVALKVDVLKLKAFGADVFEMVAFCAFVQINGRGLIDGDLQKKWKLLDVYAGLAGDDPTKRTRSQTQAK